MAVQAEKLQLDRVLAEARAAVAEAASHDGEGRRKKRKEKREAEEKRHLKVFDEDDKMEILNGKYGPYIAYDGKNYRIPKAKHESAEELTYEECMEIIKAAPEPKARGRKKS